MSLIQKFWKGREVRWIKILENRSEKVPEVAELSFSKDVARHIDFVLGPLNLAILPVAVAKLKEEAFFKNEMIERGEREFRRGSNTEKKLVITSMFSEGEKTKYFGRSEHHEIIGAIIGSKMYGVVS